MVPSPLLSPSLGPQFEHSCRVRAGHPVLGLGAEGCAPWWRLGILQALSITGQGGRTRHPLLEAPTQGPVLSSHSTLGASLLQSTEYLQMAVTPVQSRSNSCI